MRAVVAVSALFVALASAAGEDKPSTDLSNGFGTDIDWVPFPDAVSTALDLDKPVFLLIHKTWCGACKALKTSLTTSSKRKEFVELSQRFVMVNTEDDDEPEDEEYAPDGRYIPRLFFLDKYGKRMAVDNKKNYANNAHYFPQMPDVVKAMKLALELYDKQAAASPDEPVKVPEGAAKAKAKATDKKEEDESTIVETPGAEHLGEMHISEDQLAYMESGGCPHAAAARAAIIEAEKAVEEKEKAKKTDDKKGKTKKSTDEKEKTEKTTKEEAKTKKTTDEKEKTQKATDEKEKTKKSTEEKENTKKANDEKEKTKKVTDEKEKAKKATDEKEKKTPTTEEKAKKKPATEDKTEKSKTSEKKEKKQTQKEKKEEL